MQDGTYPSINFATLGPSGLRPPFTGTYKQTISAFFVLQHRAGVRLYTSFFNFAESCVFSKQSPPPLYCNQIGTPSSEVTGPFCRVPSALFSHYLSIFYHPPESVLIRFLFRLFLAYKLGICFQHSNKPFFKRSL